MFEVKVGVVLLDNVEVRARFVQDPVHLLLLSPLWGGGDIGNVGVTGAGGGGEGWEAWGSKVGQASNQTLTFSRHSTYAFPDFYS